MPNPLAIGVTIGGLLLDIFVPRPKPRYGAVCAVSPRTRLAESRTSRPGVRAVRRSAGRGRRSPLRQRSSETACPGRRAAACRSEASARYRPGHGHVRGQVPRLQGLAGRRDARPRGAARRRPRRGARGRRRAARDQHVLHHERGRGEVAPVGAALAEERARGVRRRLRRESQRAASSPRSSARDAVRRHGRRCRGRDGGAAAVRRLGHDVLAATRRRNARGRPPAPRLRQGAGRV